MDSVVLINSFEVAAGQEAECLAHWQEAADFLRAQDGFIATTLHESLDPRARFRYVNVAVWSSPEHFQQAVGTAEFQRIAARMPCSSFPALYQVVAN